MESVEREIRTIFDKHHVTDRDVARANELFRIWKQFMNWKEDETFPIRTY